MRPLRLGWSVLLVAVLAVVLGAQQLAPVAPVAIGPAWTSVPLPDMPLGVFAHAGALWVCGADAMVATSSDGGRHWRLLHRKKHGAMLFHIVFFGSREIRALNAGTALVSKDGGAHWARRARPDTGPGQAMYEHIAFGDAESIFAASGDHLDWTHDGGRHWKHATITDTQAKIPVPLDKVVARDALHVLVLGHKLPPPQLEQRGKAPPPLHLRQLVVVTTDGGEHWRVAALPQGPIWNEGRTQANAYDLYGQNQQGRPVAAASADGVHWRMLPPPPEPVNRCTWQGCLLRGGWTDGVQSWQLPFDAAQPLTVSWAQAGGTLCRVSTNLRCRSGRQAWQQPPRTHFLNVFQAAGLARPLHHPHPPDGNYAAGMVSLVVLVGLDGHVDQVVPMAASAGQLVAPAMAAARKWSYEPLRSGSQAYSFAAIVIFKTY